GEEIVSGLKERLPENIPLKDWLTYFPDQPFQKMIPERSVPSIEGNISQQDFILLLQNVDLSDDVAFSSNLLHWIVENNRSDLTKLYIARLGDSGVLLLANEGFWLDYINYAILLGHYDVFVALYDFIDTSSYDIHDTPLISALNRVSIGHDAEVDKIIRYMVSKGDHEVFMNSGLDDLFSEQIPGWKGLEPYLNESD
ncbi:MAG: hypothetical protein AAFP97_08500, partial [Pseudomonadota bacterium]